MFSRKDLDALVATDADPAVSIYLHTHTAGRDIREDPIRFDRLLGQARERLRDCGAPDIDAMTEPALALAGDGQFWRQQGRGLAMFLAKDFFRAFHLPVEVPELVTVGHRFHVTPLLPLLMNDEPFHLVTLSASRARLFEGGRWGLTEVDAGLPQGVATIAEATEYEQTIDAPPQARPQSRMAADMPSTQNLGTSPEDLRKAQLLQYLNKVATVLEKRFSGRHEPILVAAQDEAAGNFRKNVSRLPTLLPDNLSCNPDALSIEELHQRAWPIIADSVPDEREQAVEHFAALFDGGDGRATVKPDEIVKKARFGAVDKLIVADGAHLWGHYEEGSDALIRHREPETADDEDLLNYAAIHTLRQGGVVTLVPAEKMPREAVAAAILRYAYDPNASFEKGA